MSAVIDGAGTPKTKRVSHRRNKSASALLANINSNNKDQKQDKKTAVQLPTTSKDSESDESEEEVVDSDPNASSDEQNKAPVKAGRFRKNRQDVEWEIIEGLKDGQMVQNVPEKRDGLLLKRRKWPMKGWHKRFFVLEKGILMYAKSPADMLKGKYNGIIDIGLSVVTYKKDGNRIDIDSEDLIYHIKSKEVTVFQEWLQSIGKHRLFRQHEIAYGSNSKPSGVQSPAEEFATPLTSPVAKQRTQQQLRSDWPGLSGTQSSLNRSVNHSIHSIVDVNRWAWLTDTTNLEQSNREISRCQAKVVELKTLLETMKRHIPLTLSVSDPNHKLLATALPSYHSVKDLNDLSWEVPTKRRGLRFRRDNKKTPQRSSQGPGASDNGKCNDLREPTNIHSSLSNPSFVNGTSARPLSAAESLTSPHPDSLTVKEEFVQTAEEVLNDLKALTLVLHSERDKMKQFVSMSHVPPSVSQYGPLGQYTDPTVSGVLSKWYKGHPEVAASVRTLPQGAGGSALTPAGKQDTQSQTSVLDDANTDEILINTTEIHPNWDQTSNCEFYDAYESFVSGSSSDEEDEDDTSDVSDSESIQAKALVVDEMRLNRHRSLTGRRCRLPTPKPDSATFSLFGLLRKNIGRDLSKVSMPVTLNEPLSVLQRLCEELEYSDLLDKASKEDDPYMRILLVTAFAVSPYAATYYRAGQKPFNPLLGETYECIREDKGWKFIAEQVSHHPPISACYCESKNFTFWQDQQIKSKFWGKSLEVIPHGSLHLSIPAYKDHYEWNKVTTCIHNLLGGSRWVDHYGEVNIINKSTGIRCSITFVKSSYWSDTRHEVFGSVYSPDGKVIHELYGKWNEGLYYGKHPSAKCIWRPGAMPDDYQIYYGFTRFAMELNEIERDQKQLYCPTDSRFRPDQRLLEEGQLEQAEAEKHRVESLQRERSKNNKQLPFPRWFTATTDKSSGHYTYQGKYWDNRREPGFQKMHYESLW